MARYRLEPNVSVPGTFLQPGVAYTGVILREPVPHDPPIIRVHNPEDETEREDVPSQRLVKLGG